MIDMESDYNFSSEEQLLGVLRDRTAGPATAQLLDAAEHYLSRNESSSRSAISIEASIELISQHYASGRYRDAERVAERSVSSARRCPGDVNLCKALNALAAIKIQRGATSEAVQLLTEGLQLAKTLGDQALELSILTNVGAAFMDVGQIEEYFAVSSVAFRKRRSLPSRAWLVSASNCINAAVHLRDFALCREFLNLEIGSPEFIEDRLHCTVYECNSARARFLEGNLAEFERHIQRARRFAQGAGEQPQMAVELLSALSDVAAGRVEEGLRRLDSARESAVTKLPNNVPDTLEVCAQAYELAGLPHVAFGFLKEIAEWNRKSAIANVSRDLENFKISLENLGTTTRDRALTTAMARVKLQTEERSRLLLKMAIDVSLASQHDVYRCFRLGKMAAQFSRFIGSDEAEAGEVEHAGQLVDVGMIAIPSSILSKRQRLSPAELEVVALHTNYGAELIRSSRCDGLEMAAQAASAHHENWDGTGYPNGLRGEAIPKVARIVAICDTFDAMTHRRPWREATSEQFALRHIFDEGGHRFDVNLTRQFAAFLADVGQGDKSLDQIFSQDADDDSYVQTRRRLSQLLDSY